MRNKKPQAEMIIEINKQDVLDKISYIELDLLLSGKQLTEEKQYEYYKQKIKPPVPAPPPYDPGKTVKAKSLKKAGVKVNSISISLLQSP